MNLGLRGVTARALGYRVRGLLGLGAREPRNSRWRPEDVPRQKGRVVFPKSGRRGKSTHAARVAPQRRRQTQPKDFFRGPAAPTGEDDAEPRREGRERRREFSGKRRGFRQRARTEGNATRLRRTLLAEGERKSGRLAIGAPAPGLGEFFGKYLLILRCPLIGPGPWARDRSKPWPSAF